MVQLVENPGREYVSVPRAAAMLGICPKKVHALLDGGAIPYIEPVKQRRVAVADVMAYRLTRLHQRGQKVVVLDYYPDDPTVD